MIKIIRDEEQNYFDLLEKMQREVPRLAKKMGYSEETLARLWDERGYDPESVADLCGQPFNEEVHARVHEIVKQRQSKAG